MRGQVVNRQLDDVNEDGQREVPGVTEAPALLVPNGDEQNDEVFEANQANDRRGNADDVLLVRVVRMLRAEQDFEQPDQQVGRESDHPHLQAKGDA